EGNRARTVMLHHGLLIARAPLTPMERRLMSLLLTERVEKEIAKRARDHTRHDAHLHHQPVPQVRRQRALGADGPVAREVAGLTAIAAARPPASSRCRR